MKKFQNNIYAATAVSLDLKAEASGEITGYASVFGNIDRHREAVQPGAFTATLARSRASGDMPVMLWSHAQEEVIGRWTALEEDAKGLRVSGLLNLKTQRGRDAFEHVASGDAGGLSIGFTTPKEGREYAGKGVFHLKQINLFEISIVAIPANAAAKIEKVKSFENFETKAEVIDALRTAGASKRAATLIAGGGFKALASTTYNPEKIEQLARMIDAATQKVRG